MFIKRYFSVLFLFFVFVVLVSCNKENEGGKDPIPPDNAGHPRILLLEGEEQQIRDLINSDETWKKMHLAILEKSTEFLGKPTLERVMVGRRLLGTSREALKRIFYLSYAYRMTGDERYLNRADEEILAVSRFSDWNPSHFLDVAEMTMAVAIGYDWLYADLSERARLEARSAILLKGIEASKNSKYNSWLRSTNNWNQVCNAGMVYGVLAIQEDYPELATEIIDRAFESLPKSMGEYGPDGVYPEGYGYWGYGTNFNVLFLSAIEKYMGTDRGLSNQPGFLQTGHFMKHMVTPTGKSFNWGDCGTGASLKHALFWFADKTENPSILWSEKQFLEKSDFNSHTGIRELPAVMIWGKNTPVGNITEPQDKMFVGQGANPVALMRSDWTPLATYMGFKAGSPSVNHGHMDIGSFVFEAENRRWSTDLGMQNYESLESLGMQIFGKGQDAERWTIYRMNTYSHSVLIVDDQQQRVDGYAEIDKASDAEDFMYAVSDISTVYNGQLKSVKRGVGIKSSKYGVVRDEFETLDKSTKVRWQMLTFSNVELNENGATLIDDGKILKLKVEGPDNLVMKTWSTVPPNSYDAENPGTILVGFECEIPANTKQAFEVLLVPANAEADADFGLNTLDEW